MGKLSTYGDPKTAVNVFSQPDVFGCLTSARCILYAGCLVNAHLPTARIYGTYTPQFRFADAIRILLIAVRLHTRHICSRVLAISLANLRSQTR
jgi:hypothetical protein